MEKKPKTSKWIILSASAFLAVLVIIGVVFIIHKSSPSIARLLNLGQSYLEDGDYEQAIACFEDALQIDPKNPDAYFGLAEAYIGLGDPEGAIELLEYGYGLTNDIRILERSNELKAGILDGTYIQKPSGSRASEDRKRWNSEAAVDIGANDVAENKTGNDLGNEDTREADKETGTDADTFNTGAEDSRDGAESTENSEMTNDTSGAGSLYDAIRAAGHYQLFGKDIQDWNKESISAYIRSNGTLTGDSGSDVPAGIARYEWYSVDGFDASITTGATAPEFNDVVISAGNEQVVIFREYNGSRYHFVSEKSGPAADYELLGMSIEALAKRCNAEDVWKEFEATDYQKDGMLRMEVGEGKTLSGYDMSLSAYFKGTNNISVLIQDGVIININYDE